MAGFKAALGCARRLEMQLTQPRAHILPIALLCNKWLTSIVGMKSSADSFAQLPWSAVLSSWQLTLNPLLEAPEKSAGFWILLVSS